MAGKAEKKMTLTAAIHLAAPQTWPAAVLSSLLGAALSVGFGFALRPWILLGVLVTAVLLQAAVNTLNDYADFVSGLDSAENCEDTEDAALIYDISSPKAALALALAFMLAAAVIGLLLVWQAGPVLFVFAGIGLAAILLYTVPAVSFSRLPAGELLSGFAMGGAITLASFYAQTRIIDARAVCGCIPAIILIGAILCVNNTCDIEKDTAAGRKTFSVRVGRKTAQKALRTAVLTAAGVVVLETALFFSKGAAALVVMAAGLLFNYGVQGLYLHEVEPHVRPKAMGGILSACKWILGCFCAAAVIQGLG